MTKLEKKLRASLRQLGVRKEDRILVAVSGGADSTVLLDALARWKKNGHHLSSLFAAHLNHLLRGAESDADETFVRTITRQLNVTGLIEQEDVATCAIREKKNLEATARRLRYDFLRRSAEQCQANIIVTAHTRDDQVETLLMRLLRGTSGAGLQGIQASRVLSPSLQLVRPMLEITRSEVLEHCAVYQLVFREDSSNQSAEFTRNRIRQELIPLLHTFNPDFGVSLIRTATQLHEDDTYLQSEAALIVDTLIEGLTLNFKSLLKLSVVLRRRAVRLWLARSRGDLRRIAAVHLRAVDDLMMFGEGGSFVELPGGWCVHRCQSQLKLQPPVISSRICG